MKYDTARRRIQDGDVLAFRGTAAFSRLIQWRTRARVSHVGFAVWLRQWDRLAVLEAMEPHGIRLHPLRKRIQDGEWVDWHKLNDRGIHRATVVESAFQHWGSRYASPWQFVRSWGLLTRWIADRMGRDSDTNPDRFFCSELVAHCLERAGYVPDDPVWTEPATMAPADIVELPILHRMGKLEL